MRLPLAALALLLAAPAPAAEGDDPLGIDDILSEIDLGPSSEKESMTYTGSMDQLAEKYVAGKPVSVGHVGNIRVRCADRVGIAARVAYTLDGTDEAKMEAFGKGIGLAVSGGPTGGSVKTRIPAKSSAIKSADVELTVNLPKNADINVTGGDGWVQVVGCTGKVKLTNRSGGAYVSGRSTTFDVASANGDVKVEVEDGTTVVGPNRIAATNGNADLALPLGYAGKITAKGSEVSVYHTVAGTNSGTLVQGTIGTGTASLSITAKGKVSVKAP